MKAIRFTNWTNEVFVYKHDSVIYTFQPGESVMMEEPKAKHFAKHLAVISFNSKNERYTPDKLEERIRKALDSSVVLEEANESKLKTVLMNQEPEKKGVSEVNKPADEKEALRDLCEIKGVKYDSRWGVKRLKEALEEAGAMPSSDEQEFEGLKE